MLKLRNSNSIKHKIRIGGFSIKDFSAAVGVDKSYMSAILNGRSYPSPQLAFKIVCQLGVRLDEKIKISDLFFDTSVKKNTTKNNKEIL